ncbi:response regulator [Lichenibacterium ramalinae]|uniref:DNA-binding response regulator n=1 Tax=Lichenibacterium ramalinae TaxID=2316527 RepID=A0A4Q2RH76_9HYPH|nr:response regulator transcription factor [Lichenibacterium ramalinae]RYB07064.1 DNA-binding response regulator [Lichenibacterium ramalinae]
MRVLLIEDDLMIGKSLKQALQNESMVVDWTRSGVEGEEALTTNDYSAVLLDLNLPDKNGVDVLRATRQSGNKAPILVITARDDIDDRIAGLDLGADDYMVKPFDMRELVARMRAVLRRRSGIARSMLQTATMTLDLATHELTYRDQSRVLSAREFALMRALLERPGIILSRAQLEERLYGWGEEVESNALDVLIHSLRKRFDKDIIHNVRGAGWMVVRG